MERLVVLVLNSMQIFQRNLLKLLSESNRRRSELARYCGIAPSAVTAWLKCEKFPSPENLDKTAAFFQVEVSQLFETKPLSAKERELLIKFHRLNDKGKDSALGMLDVLLSNADFAEESA